jgi:Na+-translocating ferredoxin:NAD+ oxidoreductase RnfE subunit
MRPNPESGMPSGARGDTALPIALACVPLLALCQDAAGAIALGLSALPTLVCAMLAATGLGARRDSGTGIALLALLVVTLAGLVDLASHAAWPALHARQPAAAPAIVAATLILALRPMPSPAPSARWALRDTLMLGALLGATGALRELIAHGTVLAGAADLGLPGAGLVLIAEGRGLPIATLPAATFLGLALLLALRQRVARGRDPEARAE